MGLGTRTLICLLASVATSASIANPNASLEKGRHDFVPLERGNGPGQSYFDAANIKWAGRSVEVAILFVQQPDLWAQLLRYRVSCDWRSLEMLPDAVEIDANGKSHIRPLEEVEVGKAFPVWYSPFGDNVAAICDPGKAAPSSGLTTVKSAITHAQQNLARRGPAPLLMSPVHSRAEIARQFPTFPLPMRLGVASRSGENLLFVDWANLNRSGQTAEAVVVAMLGPPTNTSAGTIMMRRSHYDCANRTVSVDSYREWNQMADGKQRSDQPAVVRKIPAEGADADELTAVCKSAEPSQVFADLKEAFAYAQASWGETPVQH